MLSFFQQARTAGLFAITLLTSAAASAQYTFSHFTAPYVSFSDGTALDMQPLCDDELSTLFPIGFDFPCFDIVIDSVTAHNAFLLRETDVNGALEGVQLFPLWTLSQCTGTTSVSYKTTGTPGNRIFAVQWSGLGAYMANGPEEYVDMQAFLYEADGAIEYRFGHVNVPAGAYLDEQPGGFTGLIRYTDYQGNVFPDANSLVLSGNATNPVSVPFDMNADVNAMTGIPDSSRVYRFAPSNAALNEITAAFSISPNPATAALALTSATVIPAGKTIRVLTTGGQCVLETATQTGAQQVVDVSGLKDGLYLVAIDGQPGTQRFVKQ